MGHRFSISNPALVTLTASTAIQMIQLTNPSGNAAVEIDEIGFAAFGILSTAQKALIELCRPSAAATGTAITPKRYNKNGEAPLCTGLQPTVDGTIADLGGGELDVIWRDLCHLQGGLTYRCSGMGLLIPPNKSIILRCTAGTTASTGLARIVWSE
jgi:hypothetical protein